MSTVTELSHPESKIAVQFGELAGRVARKLSILAEHPPVAAPIVGGSTDQD